MATPFSGKEVPVQIFLDLLRALGFHGWHKAGPIDRGDFDLVPTISFHVDDELGDSVANRFERGLSLYQGKTKWILRRELNSRFFLCPEDLQESPGGTSVAGMLALRASAPDVGRVANEDLIALSNAIYQAAVLDGVFAEN